MNFYILLIFGLIFTCFSIGEDILSKFIQHDYKIKDYRTELDSFDPQYLRYMKIVTFKYNRTLAAVNASFNLKVDVAHKVEVVTQVYKFLSNEYRTFPIRYQVSMDTYIQANAAGTKALFKCGNLNDLNFKKDINYTVCNFFIDESKLPPLMPIGRYKVTITLLYLNQEGVTISSYGEVYRPIYVPASTTKPKRIIEFSSPYYVSTIQHNFQNLSRSQRHRAKRFCCGGCQIPNNPPNGKYAIRGDDTNTYKEGDYVTELSGVLYVKCDGTYRASPPEIFGSYCVSGGWAPSPGVCSRTCKSLRTTENTEVQCFFNDLALKSCDNPVDGTVAKFTCEAFYEEYSLEHNPYRFCENGEWNGIPQCYPICGQKHPVGRTNIINGINVKLGDYPWHVGVYNAKKDYRCGGSMITQRIILSAAHCFTNLATGELYPNENYLIAAGKYYREYSNPRDEHYQYSTIDSIHIPSRYKGSKLQYQADIAVVVLAKLLILTEAVQPVCVDWGNQFENQQLTPNSYGIVVGWGYTVEGLHLSDELKELTIPFVPFDQCYDSVPRAFQTFLRQDKICGGYLNSSTSVCEGDSGGGLVFPKRSTGRYFIRGVVSTSPATIERQCDSNQYGIYTLVSEHLDFINSVHHKRRPFLNTSTVTSLVVNSSHPSIIPSTTSSSINMSTVRPVSISPTATAPSTTASSCVIPHFSDNVIHSLQSSSNASIQNSHQPGDVADPFAVLTTMCSNEQSNSTSSVCVDGSWKPEPRNCSDSPILNLLPTKDVCGISQSAEDSATNVVTEAAINEFPWLVTLHSSTFEESRKDSNVCGGMLINNRYVLTAAHCLAENSHREVIDFVRLGEHNLETNPNCLNNGSRNICAPNSIDVPIAEKIIQLEYRNSRRKFGDIGLIRLEWAVDFTDDIKPICLPMSDNLINKNFENTNMIIAGWGITPADANGTKIKSKLKVPVKSHVQCATAFSIEAEINSKHICAGGFKNQRFCHGVDDSSLMKFEQDGGRFNWYAFGIFSIGIGCELEGIPIIYTRVTSYIPWIVSKLKP